MSDDKTNRGNPDRNRIAMEDRHEVRYWTEKFGVSEQALAAAVDKVGHSATKVAAFLSDVGDNAGSGFTRLVRSAFGEITGGDDEDAIALLKGDHREVEALFERFEKLEDGTSAERARIVEEICALLTVHAAVEEEIFYPALRGRSKEAADLLDEAKVEHGTVKELVARLEDMRPGDDLYKANVMVLKEYVQHHVKEEEGEMFKLAKVAELDLERLGRELEKRKLELITAVAMPARH